MDKAKTWMFMCLGLPALVVFLTMWWFRDAFITLIFLLGSFYLGPFCYNKMAGDFDWKVKMAPYLPSFTKEKGIESKNSLFKIVSNLVSSG